MQTGNERRDKVTGRRDFLIGSLAAAGLAGCAGLAGGKNGKGRVLFGACRSSVEDATGGPVELSLPDGEYIIKQISGPDGYEKVPSAPFKVEGGKIVPTGTPVNIDIEDHNITVLLPKTNSGKKTPKGGSVPATGVGVSYTNVAGAALISAAVAAMGICIVVFKKKKQEEI